MQTKSMSVKNVAMLYIMFIVFSLSGASFAIEYNLKYIEQPEVTNINREKVTASMVIYPSVETAMKNTDYMVPLTERRNASPYYLSLNGDWKFRYSENIGGRAVDFYREDFNDRDWDILPVPSNWQMYGYGVAYYINLMKWGSDTNSTPGMTTPWGPRNPPYVPADKNPVGSYRKYFELPSGWNDRQIFLHFDGVDCVFFVWINGQLAGFSKDGRTPAIFNITQFVHKGRNLAAVEVFRFADASYIEDQDKWRMSGIFRDVYLYSTPSLHVNDLFINAGLDDNYSAGTIKVEVQVRNFGSETAGRSWK